MTLPPFASLDDLEARIGPVADVTRAEAALDRASTAIRVEAGVGWVDEEGTAIDFGDIAMWLQVAIRDICVDVAERILAIPVGVRNESLGDAAIGYDAVRAGLTADEKSIIRSCVTPAGGVPGLSSVRVVAPAYASASRLLGDTFDELIEGDDT